MKAYLILVTLLVLSVSWLFSKESAAAYPAPVDMYVNDFAKVLPPETHDALRRRLERFYTEKHIHIIVVTVSSIEDYQTESPDIEAFSKALFARWLVEGMRQKLGVVILLAVKDRSARIELGRGYAHRYDERMLDIMDSEMIPHFKQGDYTMGVNNGALAVMETVKWFWWKLYVLLGVAGSILLAAVCLIFFRRRHGWNSWGFESSMSEYSGTRYDSESSGGSFSEGGSGGASGEW